MRSVKTRDRNGGIAERKALCATVAKRPIISSARTHGDNAEKDLTYSHVSVLITGAPWVLLKIYRYREQQK